MVRADAVTAWTSHGRAPSSAAATVVDWPGGDCADQPPLTVMPRTRVVPFETWMS